MAGFVDPRVLNRKVFDKYCDRMDIKLARIREDYRADLAALMKRLINLERAFDEIFPIETLDEGD